MSELVTCPHCGRRNRVPAAVAAGTPRCGHCHQPLPWIVDATDDNFAEVAEQGSVPALVDLAEEVGADLLVVGNVGLNARSAIVGRVFSVPGAVTNRAKIDVLIVRTTD